MRRSIPMTIVTAALVLGPIGIARVNGQQLLFTHGAAEGGQLTTSDERFAFGESASFSTVPNSTLTFLLAPGDSDLFVVEFTASCVVSSSSDTLDHVLVKATVSRTGVVTTFADLEPNSNDPVFCSGDNPWQSNHKMWAVRLTNNGGSQATYHFFVRVRVLDGGPQDNVMGFLGDRTVRITRYN